MISCTYCGATGRHMTSECPDLATSSKPPWCGECNPQTRLIDHGTYASRCPSCHPHGRLPLHQHKRCGGCHQLTYVFDDTKCGSHRPIAYARNLT